MIRDILNHLGEKIGDLELPNSTSEEEWLATLASYAKEPQLELIPDVSASQFRQAAFLMGVTETAMNAIIESLEEPDRTLAQIEWEYQTVFKRDNALLNRVVQTLGVSDVDVDALFILAKTL